MILNMRRHFLTLLLAVTVCCVMAQPSRNKAVIGFYNVENLFDTIDDPLKNDEQFLPDNDYRWNTERYQTKLRNLSLVISEIAKLDGGLVVLGVSEIENEQVLLAQNQLKYQGLMRGINSEFENLQKVMK